MWKENQGEKKETENLGIKQCQEGSMELDGKYYSTS
jgi:hypothetical protein